MPETFDEGRLFDEDAVAEILKRASEKQSSRRLQQSGLSLEELKQIAAESGIDPRYVTDAVREISESAARSAPLIAKAATRPDKPNFWGGPMSVTRDTVVDGVIDDFAWEEMVSEARREFTDTGEVRAWSNSREWASNVDKARSHVTVRTRDGKTRLQVFWSNPAFAALTWVPALIVSVISLPIVFGAIGLSDPLGVFVVFCTLMMAFTAARSVTGIIARHQQTRMDRLLARLQQIARLRAVPSTETSASMTVEDNSHQGRSGDSSGHAPAHEIDEWGNATDVEPGKRHRDRTG